MKGAFYGYYRELMFSKPEKERLSLAYQLLVNSGKKVTISQFKRYLMEKTKQNTANFPSRFLWKMTCLVNTCPDEDYVIRFSKRYNSVIFWAELKDTGRGKATSNNRP